MKTKFVIAFVIVTIFVTSNLSSASYTPSFWKNRQSRQEQARDWLNGFKKLNAQIPTLSPEEQLWLRNEIDYEEAGGHFTKRSLDARNSREYDIRVAKPQVDAIIGILAALSSPNLSDQRKEVILWAKLVSLFVDAEFWFDIDDLVQRGIIEKKIDGYTESLYFANYSSCAKQIMDNIVVSHLQGKLGK